MTSVPPATPIGVLRGLFDRAVDAAKPSRVLPSFLPEPPRGQTHVLGAGKAAAAMAKAVEENWLDTVSGLVVTKYGHSVATRMIEVAEAGHPVPDDAGAAAARRMIEEAARLGENDLLLCLLSGGGSALLSLPAPPVTLADKRVVTDALLRSGATINEINAVRKHLSAIKGGRLARAAYPAPTVTLAISDVVGDDPAVIASGPTVADPTTQAQAREILEHYGIAIPEAVHAAFASPDNETPKPGDERLSKSDYRIIANANGSLDAAAALADDWGYDVVDLGAAVEGEARIVAQEHAALARAARADGKRAVFLSGGELTVNVRGTGLGGPNQEYALALAIALEGLGGIFALAADTDGTDGLADGDGAAGAYIEPRTLVFADDRGLDPEAALLNNDAYGFFAALGHSFVTGPTLTNVNDFRAILIDPEF